MSTLRLDNHALLTVIISLVFVVIVILAIQLKIIFSYFNYDREIGNLKPKIARFAGLIESEDKLLSLEVLAGDELSFYVYPHTAEKNVTGAQMQKSLRSVFTDVGMTVTGSKILTLKGERGFSRIGISLTLDGTINALESALMRLEGSGPAVFVDEIDIKPKRERSRRGVQSGRQSIDVKIKLISFKVEVN